MATKVHVLNQTLDDKVVEPIVFNFNDNAIQPTNKEENFTLDLIDKEIKVLKNKER